MKILYFSQFYFPENVAASFRATDNSTLWSELGNDITLFTTYPNFPTGKIFSGYKNKLLSVEYRENVRILRSKIYCNKSSSKIKKVFSYLSYFIFSLINFIFNKKEIGNDYDVVLGTSGTIFNAYSAYLYSKIIRKPFVLELRDITYVQYGAVFNNKGILQKIVRYLELNLCNKADKIITVTQGFKKILVEDGIKAENIHVIYNGILFNENTTNEIHDFHKKDEVTFSYIGNLGKSQNLNKIIDMFINLNIKNSRLLFIGEGAMKKTLEEIAQKYHNIEIIPGKTKEELKKYYKETDIALISLKIDDNFKYTIPSKVFENMYNNKFIMFIGPNGEAAEIIKNANCGVVYNSFNLDSEEIVNIRNIIENKQYMNELAQNGYEYVIKNFNRKELAIKYIDILYNLKRGIKNEKSIAYL